MIKGKILLVDWHGDPDCRACELRDAGWFVDVEFEDGGQAYRLARTEQPDVVVIDLSSRPSHGRELAFSLRDTRATCKIPLVFLGGDDLHRAKISQRIPDAAFAEWAGLEPLLNGIRPSDEG